MQLDSFLQSAVLLLLVTSVAVALFKHLGLGSVLGLLVAGMIVGPHSPGPYVTTHVEDMRHFTELGVVLLLFLIGLEMQPSRLWAMRRELFGLGTLQILVSGALIGGYVRLSGTAWPVALLGGLTLALSSTAFAMQILRERGEIASRHGQAGFGVLLMQDLAVVPLLALVPIVSDRGTLNAGMPLWEQAGIVIGMCGLVWLFGRHLVPWALRHMARQGNRDGFGMMVLLAVLLSAWAMREAGLSMALGAFLMGMLLSGSRYNYQIEAQIEPYKGLLMSLFFVAVGMSLDPAPLLAAPLRFLQHLLVILAIKLGVLVALGLAFGLGVAGALRLSGLLAQAGEFGFVLFGSARGLGLIDDGAFALGVGVISSSMLVTPLLVRLGDALARRWDSRRPLGPTQTLPEPGPNRPVILGGYGRVGHTVAVILHSTGVPFIAFDSDPERVARGQADGFPVYFGDLGDPALWAAAHAEHAALVVLTIDHGPTALRVVSHLRSQLPQLQVVSRAHDLESCGRLLQAGASYAFPEAVESSMRLGAQVLELMGVPMDNVDLLLTGVRRTNYSLVREDPVP
jgi:glutathione-regulated potassium-efflux system protein KefB